LRSCVDSAEINGINRIVFYLKFGIEFILRLIQFSFITMIGLISADGMHNVSLEIAF